MFLALSLACFAGLGTGRGASFLCACEPRRKLKTTKGSRSIFFGDWVTMQLKCGGSIFMSVRRVRGCKERNAAEGMSYFLFIFLFYSSLRRRAKKNTRRKCVPYFFGLFFFAHSVRPKVNNEIRPHFVFLGWLRRKVVNNKGKRGSFFLILSPRSRRASYGLMICCFVPAPEGEPRKRASIFLSKFACVRGQLTKHGHTYFRSCSLRREVNNERRALFLFFGSRRRRRRRVNNEIRGQLTKHGHTYFRSSLRQKVNNERRGRFLFRSLNLAFVY